VGAGQSFLVVFDQVRRLLDIDSTDGTARTLSLS
jgi:hypothetical protein